MNMDSFVVTIGEFFKMDRGMVPNFDCDRVKYVIPKYQREYKWDEERVLTLISDIKNRDKFIGNVIINKVENYYEIVDGQQRITTIMLILIALFNRNKHLKNGIRSEEQKTILNYLTPRNTFILENESIGHYISIHETHIDIRISMDEDIYFQNETFEKLYRIIDDAINNVEHGIKDIEILNFQKKVLDCQMLVLIGEPDGRQQDSIEEIFLDINFKSQLLDVANIFKGYCFKNYVVTSHSYLKDQWATIRSHTKQFENRFGYEENRETCEYLYLYLLSMPESYKIPANLSVNGKHYLEEKNHTQTKDLLDDMIDYGNKIINFDKKLLDVSYFFEDICSDAKEHKNEIVSLQTLKNMAMITIESREAQYYKLPFFMFIYYTKKCDDINNAPDFVNLKALITNFYVYAFLFSNSGKQKNKSLIAYNLLDALHNHENIKEKTNKILNEIKVVRKRFLEDFTLFRNYNKNKGYAFYSIMDYYVANNNFIKFVYSAKSDFTPEHLLIHDNTSMNVTWKDGINEFTFSLKELLGKPDGKNYKGTVYKKQTINYLILPRQLNEDIKSNDIVSKIFDIEKYFANRKKVVPKHINVILTHIKGMTTFQELSKLKETKNAQSVIENKYKYFINSYFSDENQAVIYNELEKNFKGVFQNQV